MSSPKSNKIVFDLDDTICFPNHEEKDSFLKYGKAKPNEPLIQKLRIAYDQGWCIIIESARRMVTHKGDLAKIEEDIGKITQDWLVENNVPYDELRFGKTYADWYVDDKSLTPEEFMKRDFNAE